MKLDMLKNLSKAKVAAVVGAALSVLLLLAILIYSMSRPVMVPLFGDLSQEDASLVVSKLQAMGKSYSSDSTGRVITVPVKDVLSLRMQLAQDGIPSQSQILGYELFDKEDILGTSQFVNNVNQLRALEGELVRTINSLSEIDQSRVHIVMAKSDYFSKSGPESSASVFVKVKNGRKLNDLQVSGIANLVAAAVPGLTLDNVSIVDQNGKPLKTPGEDQDSGSKNISEYKNNIEGKLKRAVEDLVSKYVGLGKVQANVTAEIDFDKIVVNQEEYVPDSQVVRSERNSNESSTDTEMEKNVSAGTNVPNFLQKSQPNSVKQYNKEDGITNYEVSKTITNKVIQWGAIKQLSVAVLIDGIYERDRTTNKEVYLRDRTEAELTKIKQLVSAAIGADESRGDRVEVMNLPFAQQDLFAQADKSHFPQYDSGTIAQVVIVLLIIIIAGLLFFKPRLTKILNKDKQMAANDIPESLTSRLSKSEMNDETKENKPFAERQYEELLSYINNLAGGNREDVIKVIRNWILQK
jgi:flagellar M-ring protein FliF